MAGDIVNDFFKHRKEVPPQLERRFRRVCLAIGGEFEGRAAQHRPGRFLHSQHQLVHGVGCRIQKPDDVPQRINGVCRHAADLDQFLGDARGLFGDHFTEQGDRAEIAAHFIVQVAGHAQTQAREPSFERQPHFISSDE